MPVPRPVLAPMLLLALAVLASPASADILLLTNGKMHLGEVVEESSREIRFRMKIRGVWTTLGFKRRDIELLEIEEGNQSDLGAAEPGEVAPPSTPRGERRVTPRATGPLVSVIPLHGQVGGVIDDRMRGTFDAGLLAQCFEQAERDGAKLVVLDVESPGGLVSEMEAICETIIDWHDRLRIVAFPREAYSAAAIICMSCRELAVRPSSQFGAAVIVRQGRGGMSALDAKLASPHYARQRRYMEASGQPYEVVEAMTIQPTELWWSPVHGFATTLDDGQRRRDDWLMVDDEESVLTLTAAEALQWNVAHAAASDVRELAVTLGIGGGGGGDLQIVSQANAVSDYLAEMDREHEKLRDSLQSYFGALLGIRQGMVTYLAAAKNGNETAMKEAAAEVNRHRSAASRAARRIEASNKRVLARRGEMPDAIVERVREDRSFLRRIPSLVRSGSARGFNEAADQFNEMIREWKRLLGIE